MPVLQRTRTIVAILLVLALPGLAKPAEPAAAIFDGETLSGWGVGPGDETLSEHWGVVDGMIYGENADKLGSILWTDAQYSDFEITLEYRSPTKAFDSGVFLRGESHQVQIGVSNSLKVDMTGCIYAPSDGRGKYPATSEKVAAVHRQGDWNKLRVVVSGDRIQSFLNNEPMVDYEAATMPDRGPIGLQLHAGQHIRISFRDITVKEIPTQESD